MLEEAFEINGRKYAVSGQGRPLTEEDLTRFEGELGVRLPDQLRSYYRRWNGGLPHPLDVPEFSSLAVRVHWREGAEAARSGKTVSLGGIQCFDDELEDFMENWEAFKDRYPKGFLAFQRDPGGSLFLIGVAPHNLGRIFFWDRWYEANRDEGEFPSLDNIADVAPSFVDYLAAFRNSDQLPGETDDEWIRRNYGTD